ncbi:hypothetical protein B0H13DRAFT_2006338 [Mycena leptocephala]|nr:hypothetical protein B0H13DRAFT_2006338 [Mycena leptocephala]
MGTPFTVQELVNRCVDFLGDSTPDLKACALVSRSWVYPAQAHVFREIWIAERDPSESTHEVLWDRLQETLETSPHLIRHIRRLEIVVNGQWLSKLCNFPFTHLEHVQTVLRGEFTLEAALAFRQLFSLPTLRSVNLEGTKSPESTTFVKIFERCSPAVRKLELDFFGDPPFSAVSETPAAPIPLASLMIATFGAINRPFLPGLHPFSTSNLKAFKIESSYEIVWHELEPAIKTIEILSIRVQSHISLNLSAFPRLSVLYIHTGTLGINDEVQGEIINTVLSTIPTEHNIHTIVITRDPSMPRSVWEALDLTLSRLRLSTVELHVYGPPENLPNRDDAVCFPQSSAKDILRVVPYNPNWWEDITSGL